MTFYSHFTRFTRGEKETTVNAGSVRETIEDLALRYGDDFRSRLLKENGEPREFVRIFLNDRDIRVVGNLEARTSPDDQLLFVPALAGG